MIQPTDDPVTTLADGIRDIAKAMKQLEASGLKRRTIVTLLADSTCLGKREINNVLDSLRDMEKEWCS
jgi:hypothetical protein